MKYLLICLASLACAQVSWQRLSEPGREAQNWLTYSGSHFSQRHSALDQINRANVGQLQLKWVFQSASFEKFESSPLVVDGILYTVQMPNDVVAMDAATGRLFWTYRHNPAPIARVCCGRVNRGLAILDDTLFLGTIDGRLIALDAHTGKAVWNTAVARPEAGYSITLAPLIVKDKVLIGTAGGEYGIRGFVAAYDAKTSKEAWRFYTIPAPGEPGSETWPGDSWKTGAGSIWLTGSYDASLNLTYWGVGNPGPDWNGESRRGDNLYSDSVIALDADTGKLKWYYQFTPHDELDYDSVQIPVLADAEFQGKPRKLMFWANRNGLYYVLDRATGEFLLGKPFTKVTWMDGFDERGRPRKLNSASPTREGTKVFPSVQGGTNWYSPSYSPRTGLFYIPAWLDTYSVFVKRDEPYQEGQRFMGGFPRTSFGLNRGEQANRRGPEEGHGGVLALDALTGEKKWQFDFVDVTNGGILTTASDLLFTGNREENFLALDARNGALLWKANLGGNFVNGPITYAVKGKQYVAVAAGNSLFVFGLP